MMKIFESIQELDDFLKNDEKILLEEEIPSIKSDPESVDEEVCQQILDDVVSQFPDENSVEIVNVSAIKVQGNETEIISTNHNVIKYNGYFYDYTAHQFSDEFNNLLTFGQIPVIQQVISSNSQLNERISTVKYYALIENRDR